jgi:Ser/Thr protein kinase RdoA (MazF antagonist)
MESLVQEALLEYEFKNPQLTFIRHNENITYMLEADSKKYVIRIRRPVEGFKNDIFGSEFSLYELMENEMMLIDFASKNTEIKLQKPVRNKKGELVSCLCDGSPVCVLEWIEGCVMNEKSITEEQAKKLGVMAAKLQKGLQGMECKLKRFSYTRKLILPMKEQLNDAVQKGQISVDMAVLMKEALDVIEDRMDELDIVPGMKGIVHADLGLSNVIVSEEGLVPIDFSLSGYGYYFMDVAMMMSQFKDKKIRSYIKQGYERESNQEVPVRYIDAFFAFCVLLYICCQHDKASHEDWFEKAMERWCNTIFNPLVNGVEYVL